MKKLFISCPMKGRTEENIRKSMDKMHRIAEIVFDQELEVIPTYITDNPPKNAQQAVWYLGKAIQMMAEADFYIGIGYSDFFHGCSAENDIAQKYGIQCTFVNVRELMPDAIEVEENYWRSMDEMVANPKEC